MLSHHDSSIAPQKVQTALPVRYQKLCCSAFVLSAHRTMVAILRICPSGRPDQPKASLPQAQSRFRRARASRPDQPAQHRGSRSRSAPDLFAVTGMYTG